MLVGRAPGLYPLAVRHAANWNAATRSSPSVNVCTTWHSALRISILCTCLWQSNEANISVTLSPKAILIFLEHADCRYNLRVMISAGSTGRTQVCCHCILTAAHAAPSS